MLTLVLEIFIVQACYQQTETGPLGQDLCDLKRGLILEQLIRKFASPPKMRKYPEEVAPLELIYAL